MDGLWYYAITLAAVLAGAYIGGGTGLLLGLVILAGALVLDDLRKVR